MGQATHWACCDQGLDTEGCATHTHHVYDQLHELTVAEFRRTPKPNGDYDPRSFKIYALDCEMVYTTFGVEVARLALVDAYGDKVLDLFVKPEYSVVDYITHITGLTEEIVAKRANHTLETVSCCVLR